MEDSLMRVFGGERVKNLMGTFGIPEDQPIEMRMISRQLESAQTRIEGFHFDSRKQVLAYDDVLNQQRLIIYARRKKLLTGDMGEVNKVLEETKNAFRELVPVIEAKRVEFGEENFMTLIQRLSLQTIDTLWVEHLEVMQYTRANVNLRAYGQRDPLIEYRKEGTLLFAQMQETALSRIATMLPNLQPAVIAKEEEEHKKTADTALKASGKSATATRQETRIAPVLPSRNDMVTITNGTDTQTLKYKKAESLLAEGWQLVTEK
jgi:preprotein translocase subunit SecA